mmetsp:Transcript_18171/g.43714  ORF Transcript_18171/g.43714 Transcript_18171/m.43714 type:complete len:364 (+) Transcript_18171:984-2075(+)
MLGQGMDGTTCDCRGGLMRGMYGMVVAGLLYPVLLLLLREGISMARMMMIRASLSLLLGHDTRGHALMVRDLEAARTVLSLLYGCRRQRRPIVVRGRRSIVRLHPHELPHGGGLVVAQPAVVVLPSHPRRRRSLGYDGSMILPLVHACVRVRSRRHGTAVQGCGRSGLLLPSRLVEPFHLLLLVLALLPPRPLRILGAFHLLAMPPQPFGDLVHEALGLVVDLPIVPRDRLRQLLEGYESVALPVRTLLVLAGQELEEPPGRRQGEVVVPTGEGGKAKVLVLDHGAVGRVDGIGYGVYAPPARLEEELTFEHEEDVEVVVLLGALLVPGLLVGVVAVVGVDVLGVDVLGLGLGGLVRCGGLGG